MLNLDICEKCLKKTAPEAYEKGLARDWIELSGLISCERYNVGLVRIAGAPPADCPYKLEHGVSEAMKDAQ